MYSLTTKFAMFLKTIFNCGEIVVKCAILGSTRDCVDTCNLSGKQGVNIYQKPSKCSDGLQYSHSTSMLKMSILPLSI